MIKQVQSSQVVDVHIDQIGEKQGKFGPYLLWAFKDGKNNRYVGFTETIVRPGNRVWVWMYGIGKYLEVGDSLDFESLKGLLCRAYLNPKDSTVLTITSVIKSPVKDRAETTSDQVKDSVTPEEPIPSEGDASGLFS